MNRYQIWNGTDAIITPSGAVFTAEQWKDKYPMANMPNVKMVIGGGTINGSVCMELSTLVTMYEHQGADFSECENDQEILDIIEAWEDMSSMPVEEEGITALDSIASSLEFMAMSSLPDEF